VGRVARTMGGRLRSRRRASGPSVADSTKRSPCENSSAFRGCWTPSRRGTLPAVFPPSGAFRTLSPCRTGPGTTFLTPPTTARSVTRRSHYPGAICQAGTRRCESPSINGIRPLTLCAIRRAAQPTTAPNSWLSTQ
jgi:hypothetical protein